MSCFVYTGGPQQAPMESFYPMVTHMTLEKPKRAQYIQEKGSQYKTKVMHPGKGLAGMGVWNGQGWEGEKREWVEGVSIIRYIHL